MLTIVILRNTLNSYKYFDILNRFIYNILKLENISRIENILKQSVMDIIEKLSEFLQSVYPKALDSSMPLHDIVLLILLIAAICWILSIVSTIVFPFDLNIYIYFDLKWNHNSIVIYQNEAILNLKCCLLRKHLFARCNNG